MSRGERLSVISGIMIHTDAQSVGAGSIVAGIVLIVIAVGWLTFFFGRMVQGCFSVLYCRCFLF